MGALDPWSCCWKRDGSVGSVLSWLGVCFTAVLRMGHALWPWLHIWDSSRMLLTHCPIFWDPSANLVLFNACCEKCHTSKLILRIS
jgi:hypothetical protein